MMNNVTPRHQSRIGAVRARDQIRIAVPSACVLVPVAEFALFVSLTRAIAASHQRAAVRALQGVQ